MYPTQPLAEDERDAALRRPVRGGRDPQIQHLRHRPPVLAGGRARAVVADVADEDAWSDLVRVARTEYGPVGVLVSNAYTVEFAPAGATTRDSWDRQLADPLPLRIVDGHIHRLDSPSLGITVDEEAVRRADQTGHAWRNPVWRHDDGSFAEW